MPEFTQDIEETPVLFRVSRAPKRNGAEVAAVFPCVPADTSGDHMTCYTHVGQHGACSFGWYATTRAAKPAEYAGLKRELESAPYGYRLNAYKRLAAPLRAKLLAELRRLRDLEKNQ
jgi:hypothetical protein